MLSENCPRYAFFRAQVANKILLKTLCLPAVKIRVQIYYKNTFMCQIFAVM